MQSTASSTIPINAFGKQKAWEERNAKIKEMFQQETNQTTYRQNYNDNSQKETFSTLESFAKSQQLEKQQEQELESQANVFVKTYSSIWLADILAKQVLKDEQSGKVKVSDETSIAKAYVLNTFGNPVFIKSVEENVKTGLDRILTNKTDSYISRFNAKLNADKYLDDTLNKVANQTTRVTDKLDKLGKLDLIKALNDKLNTEEISVLSEEMLDGALDPHTASILKNMGNQMNKTTSIISSSSFYKTIQSAQNGMLKASAQLKDAVNKAQVAVQKLKTIVTQWKDRIYKIAKTFTVKIVGAVRDAITQSINSMTSKWISTVNHNSKS